MRGACPARCDAHGACEARSMRRRPEDGVNPATMPPVARRTRMGKTRVTLAYGKTGLDVELPADRTTVIEPKYLAGLPDEAAALRQAMRQPHASEPLRQRVPAGARVAIVVCDVTRATPTSR